MQQLFSSTFLNISWRQALFAASVMLKNKQCLPPYKNK